MTQERVSLLSTVINFSLAVLKLVVGFIVNSAALIADGIHSGLDILSSLITFLGIKAAQKPADVKHPYGHLRYETLAGFMVTLLLLVSAVWIIYEGVTSILQGEVTRVGAIALGVVILSIIVNELMARLKFKIGEKTSSLALVADAEHSRADSLSSFAVLIGLFATRWFVWADGAAAILIGLYILYQTFFLGREIIDNLLDISNPEIEKKIKEICTGEEIELLGLRTRKIGPENFAEVKIGLARDWKMQKVEEVITNLEDLLKEKIPSLKFVVIQVVSHELKRGYIKSQTGQIRSFKELPKTISLKKLGVRSIIPLSESNELSPTFGAPYYLVVDEKDGNVVQKKKIKNPYFTIGRGHGVRFAREVEADKVLTLEIGEHAKESLKNLGVEIKTVSKEENLDHLLKV